MQRGLLFLSARLETDRVTTTYTIRKTMAVLFTSSNLFSAISPDCQAKKAICAKKVQEGKKYVSMNLWSSHTIESGSTR